MSDPVETLLAEIRDVQREHLAEYRRVTAKLLDAQAVVLRRQARVLQIGIGGFIRIAVGVAIVLAASIHAGH